MAWTLTNSSYVHQSWFLEHEQMVAVVYEHQVFGTSMGGWKPARRAKVEYGREEKRFSCNTIASRLGR
jgi:hypothetical protein